MPPRPLSPATTKLYNGVLARAFGNAAVQPPFNVPAELATWTESNKALLRAAVKRRCLDLGLSEEQAVEEAEDIPVSWSAKRVTDIPAEEEAVAYEKACGALPAGRRAMALLPLALGLRAEEAITLSRKAVERGASFGELVVMRKGGKEQRLPAANAKSLFEELLAVRGAKRTSLFESCLAEGRPWKVTGDILSTGDSEAAYHALYRLVRDTGEAAGIEDLRPHKLRHAFATRMDRDGAGLPVIQWMLGHSDIRTTMRYVHPGQAQAARYVRQF